MKKMLVIVSLLLALSASACAESPVVSNDVAYAMLESALENGFSPNKDIQAMLDNAWMNGYDYFSIKQTPEGFWVKVAVYGLREALTEWENINSDEAQTVLMQAKETVFSHCQSILDLNKMVGRDDLNIMFLFLDDEPLTQHGISEMNLAIIRYLSGEEMSMIYTQIEAWKDEQ